MAKVKFAERANLEARNPHNVLEARKLVKQMSEKEINISDPFFYSRIMSRFFSGAIGLKELREGSHS